MDLPVAVQLVRVDGFPRDAPRVHSAGAGGGTGGRRDCASSFAVFPCSPGVAGRMVGKFVTRASKDSRLAAYGAAAGGGVYSIIAGGHGTACVSRYGEILVSPCR